MMSDWDLQAVIRGWSRAASAKSSTNPTAGTSHEIVYEPLDPGFEGQLGQEHEFFGDFPDVFESGAAADFFDELEGMCSRPFYDELAQGQAQVTVGHGSSSSSQPQQPAVAVKEEEEQPVNNGLSPVVSAVSSSGTAAQVTKYKRSRKNQQKRVVQQARAEGLSSSDKWAWRKYGQKPIKGSPYPRSYYRCSSSKGCPARKQVEQSRADPAMHLITYTGDHNHSHPTRRNSLSGVARNKFPNPTRLPHRQVAGPVFVKTEDEDEGEEGLVPGIVFSDDLFPSLEDLHGCILD